MTRALLALTFVVAVTLAFTARAEPVLTADLSTHQIQLAAGTSNAVTLFGTVDAPGDIVVVVRGPDTDATVERGPFGNFWLTAHRITFGGVPGFYAVYASAPLDTIAPADVQATHQIGLANLRFQPRSAGEDPALVQRYRAALITERERAGLYADSVGKVAFDGNRLFRATLALPAEAPAGNYFIEVLLLRDKALVGGQTMTLAVAGSGSSVVFGGVADWALVLYGALAVLAIAVAGGVASRLRRRRLPAAESAEAPSAKTARRR
jgi:uncharacterized protein (TIGR02186 family)